MNGEEGAARRRSARSGRRAPPRGGDTRGGGGFEAPPAHTPERPGPERAGSKSGERGTGRGQRPPQITAGDSLRGTAIELGGSGRGLPGPSGTARTEPRTGTHGHGTGTDGQGQPGTGAAAAGRAAAARSHAWGHGGGHTDTQGHGVAPHTQPPHPPPGLPCEGPWDPTPRGKGRGRKGPYGLSQRQWNRCRTGARCRSRCAATGGLGVLGKSFLTEKENQKNLTESGSQALPSRSDAGGSGSGKGPGEPLVLGGKGLSPGLVEHQGCVPGHSGQISRG
ncbi:spidroin-2-like [Poecile atricapillus]|uniref:spidroin-2-like n=1 Tax=Poecile atricapillus TaxID=48891 RepID=UPI0027392407|nr:spidroin-2-like [Poecile atricapillus]